MDSAASRIYSIKQGDHLRRSSSELIDETRLKLLRDHLRHAGKSLFYQERFSSLKFIPEDIKDLSDLRHLPITDRDDLARQGNDFTPEGVAISDICYTSGTTGDPVIVPYSANDIERLAFNEAMGFSGAGIKREDRVLLTVTLDKGFIAGLAYYRGVTYLGASAIRSGPGQLAQQWRLIERMKPTILLGVPSFLATLAQWGETEGYSCWESSIRAIVTIGEPVQDCDLKPTALGSILHDRWQVPVFSSYGGTEIETGFCDCRYHLGCHVHPELMMVEIVDEEGTPLPPGSPGEVVVTPLGVEGLPLVRFRTGDISRMHTEPCDCGWNTERLGPIEGRISQRLKFKGTTLYPDMILQVLHNLPGTEDSYVEVRQNYDLADDITIVVGIDENTLDLDGIKSLLQAHLRVTPRIVTRDRKKVLEMTGKGKLRKPKRFFDYRHIPQEAEKQPGKDTEK